MARIPQEPIFFRFRIDPEMRRLLDRLREEKDINVSAWARRVFRDALHLMFPDAAATTETQEAEPEQEAEQLPPLPPLELPEVQEPDQQKPPIKQQKPPIKGWKPRKLPNDEWGAALEGEMVAKLPGNDQLLGTPIVVEPNNREPWTTTIEAVVDRTDSSIVVSRPHRDATRGRRGRSQPDA